MSLPSLTHMQARTLDELITWWWRRREIPSRLELSAALGHRSTIANHHMKLLDEKGYISIVRERSRALTILFDSKGERFVMESVHVMRPRRCETCDRTLFDVPCPRCDKYNTRKKRRRATT